MHACGDLTRKITHKQWLYRESKWALRNNLSLCFVSLSLINGQLSSADCLRIHGLVMIQDALKDAIPLQRSVRAGQSPWLHCEKGFGCDAGVEMFVRQFLNSRILRKRPGAALSVGLLNE